MAKSESADTLLKRLQKIQRAQARLGDITTRIRAQADTLAELLAIAHGFVADGDTPKAAPTSPRRGRSTAAAAKATAARRTATRRTTPPATTPRRSRAAAPGGTTRRAPRKPGSV